MHMLVLVSVILAENVHFIHSFIVMPFYTFKKRICYMLNVLFFDTLIQNVVFFPQVNIFFSLFLYMQLYTSFQLYFSASFDTIFV